MDKANNFKGTFIKLVSYISKYHVLLVVVAVLTTGASVFNIIAPKVLGMATTEIYKGMLNRFSGTGGIDFTKLLQIILVLIALYVFSMVMSFVQGIIMADIVQKIAFTMRREISEKLHHLPMNYYDRNSVGDVLSRITNDVDTLSQGLNESVTQIISSVATLVGILVMMFSISPLMTLIALMLFPASAICVAVIFKKSQKYFAAQQKLLGDVNGRIEECFGGHNIIKLFAREEISFEEFKDTNEKLYDSSWKAQFFSGLIQPIMVFVGNLGYVGVVILGGYLSIKGVIEVGDIQSFIQYVREFTQPIEQVAQISNMLQSTVAAAERVFAILEEEEEKLFTDKHTDMALDVIKGNVSFSNVCFGYNPDKIILKDFSADIKEGEKIAIVGPTGAGKTTLVKLLMRFYDINSGCIYIDGINVNELDKAEVRNAFGMVLQDTWLFKGTIMENIRYGRLEATDEEVIEAAKAAYAHHFIETLPGGYDMELNEEATNVSQGQKQLITIARAILADKKLLILDEATSSVDTRTELKIQKAMINLMKGRTSFIIAHRLSTIRDADRILVMKDGNIVEQGNHEELMERKGYYAELSKLSCS